LFVGGINVVQGIVWFALLHALLGDTVPYLLVLVLVYLIAVPIGFVLYRTIVFRVSGGWVLDFGRFLLVQSGGFAINVCALPIFHEVFGLPLLAAQVLSILVILVFNYLGHLYVSFRRSKPHGSGAAPDVDSGATRPEVRSGRVHRRDRHEVRLP
jgi:putative flippase GtrA